MLNFIKEHADGVFDPESLAVLVAAFDDAWAQVLRSGVTFGTEREKARLRETIARRIILLAQNGERNAQRLRDDALLHLRR